MCHKYTPSVAVGQIFRPQGPKISRRERILNMTNPESSVSIGDGDIRGSGDHSGLHTVPDAWIYLVVSYIYRSCWT